MKENTSYSVFFGKKILLGVSGSIAAYKTPELVRFFKKKGAEVKVLLTKDASTFVSPLTLSTLSLNDVIIDFTDESGNKWNNHIELSLWADIFLIAPAQLIRLRKWHMVYVIICCWLHFFPVLVLFFVPLLWIEICI